jgi:molybdate transport system regulatory protein
MSAVLAPHDNLWIERDGLVVLSRWRIRLLEAIEDTGSISAAARRMDVEYHRAWEKLAEMEKGLGTELVDRQVGGAAGGGARLTAAGRDYVARFNSFEQGIDDLIALRFEQTFLGAGPG